MSKKLMFPYRNYALAAAIIATQTALPAIAKEHSAVWNKAYNLVRKNDNSAAIEVLNKGVSENPKNAELFYFRGALLANEQNYKHSINDQNKVIDLSKDRNLVAAAYLSKASSESYLKQDDKAEQDYQKLLKKEPNLKIAHLEYAVFLYRTRRGKEAVSHVERSKKLDKQSDEIYQLLKIADTGKYVKRAMDLVQVNEQDKAISVLKDGIKMTPNDIELQKVLNMLEAEKKN